MRTEETRCAETPSTGAVAGSAATLFISVVLFAVMSILPLEGAYPAPDGSVIQGWFSKSVCHCFPLLALVLFAFSGVAWAQTGRVLGKEASRPFSAVSVLRAMRPLAFLPVIVAVRHMSAWVGTTPAALSLPLGSAVVAALCAERLSRPFFESHEASSARDEPTRRAWLPVFAVFAAFFAFYLGIHLWQDVNRRFAGGGDVVHYNFQLQNLVEKGNLDLTDRMGVLMDSDKVSEGDRPGYIKHSHMRKNGNGRIYSVHAFGWPLLAYPFAKTAGDAGVVLFMLLLGGGCVAGVFASCIRSGASKIAAIVASVSLGASWWWSYVSLNRLPEMLGCALCIWGFWAVLAQSSASRRWIATAVSLVSVSYLPVAHMRFYPISVVLAVAFWISGMTATEKKRGDAARLSVHAICAVAAWIGLWLFHKSMFVGAPAFRMGNIFFSHPSGMLGVFADRRGVITVMPLVWLLATAPFAFMRGVKRETRTAAYLAMALEVATLVACNANQGSLVGSCVTARYFLQAVPPLVPLGALWLDRAGRPGRFWWFALAFPAVFYLFVVSPFCSGNGLVHSPYGAWDLDAFRNFWHPYRYFFSPIGFGPAILSLILPAAMFAIPWVIRRRNCGAWRLAVFASLLAVALVAGLEMDRITEKPVREGAWLALGNANHWKYFRRVSGPSPQSFFSTFDGENCESESGVGTLVLSSDPEAQHSGGKFLLNSTVARNDWAGRPLRWAELAKLKSRSNRRGSMAIRVSGQVEGCGAWIGSTARGNPDPPLGVHVGEGKFDVVLLVASKPAGTHRHVFGALDSETGTLSVDSVQFAPWRPGLENAAGSFPRDAIVQDTVSRRK